MERSFSLSNCHRVKQVGRNPQILVRNGTIWEFELGKDRVHDWSNYYREVIENVNLNSGETGNKAQTIANESKRRRRTDRKPLNSDRKVCWSRDSFQDIWTRLLIS